MTNESPRFIQSESFKRDPGPDFTEEALERQKAAFKRAGGKVQVIPAGVGTGYKSPAVLADEARRIKGGQKGAAGRKGIGERRAMKIRMEDGL